MKKIILFLLLIILPMISLAQSEIEENQISNSEIAVSVYPNPATNIVHIGFKNYLTKKIEIYDVLGKLVLKTKKSTGINLSIDTSNLISGFYLTKITVGNKSVIKKLIIL